VTAAWVFVDSVDEPAIDDADAHHLSRVLRLRDGESLVVSDGRGRWRHAVWRAGAVDAVGDVLVTDAPVPAITIAFALTKGEKPELAVQKLTELGVDVIVPFAAARSVARWDPEKAARNGERLRRIAREASMQCRRAWLPTVLDAMSFADVAAMRGASIAEAGAVDGPSLATPTVLVGPEGGWGDEELGAGLPRVGLGPHVLRAETAAIAAATLLSAQRARLVGPFRAE